MGERWIRSRCACGWEVSGAESEVVAAMIEHGRRSHDMETTAEQVLEQVEILEDAGE